MVLGSPLTGDNTANGTTTMTQQGSRLSQMQDSFRKQMLRDKEKAKVSPGATRTSAAPTRNGGPPTPTRQPPPKTRTVEEERKPLTQRTTPKLRVSEEKKAASPAKLTPTSAAAKPRTSPKSSTASISSPKSSTASISSPKSSTASISSPSPPARTSTAMKKVPSTSAAAAQSDLPTCRNCGRHFAQDRLPKHEEICVKTSKKKRKVFDPMKMRVKGTEAEAYIKSIKKAPKAPAAPKVDWRRQHEDFIRSIRDAKAAQAHLAAGGKLSDLPPPPPMDTSHLTPCPHCGRKFNDTAAQRHIPRCKDTINKPKPPPGARAGPSSAGRGARTPLRR